MTSSGNWALRIDLGDWEGNTAYATYTGFYITSCADNYRLMFDLGSYSGDAGAWWFGYCADAHLNGEYMTSSTATHGMGLSWYGWKGDTYSLKFSEMKLKRA
nr:hypothetical protein BaRGS_014945 [Batillaria attramentaria]